VPSGKTVMIGIAGGDSGLRGPYSLRWSVQCKGRRAGLLHPHTHPPRPHHPQRGHRYAA
jgi:hypothetical protein